MGDTVNQEGIKEKITEDLKTSKEMNLLMKEIKRS